MTVYELIQQLARQRPDDEVHAGVVPAGNRKIKNDLLVNSVSVWGELNRGAPREVTILLRRKESRI